jgi:hypothetical protein
LWRGRWLSSSVFQEEWKYEVKAESLNRDHLREQFDKLKGVARGEGKIEDLPCYEKYRPKKSQPAAFDADLDDDVPF